MMYDMKAVRLKEENPRTSSSCWVTLFVHFLPLLLDLQIKKIL